MKSEAIILIVLFGASTSCTAVASFVLFAMIGEINRARDTAQRIQYFRFSWIQVFREYRSLYPDGKFSSALVMMTVFAGIFGALFLYVLFGVLPKYSIPSR